MSLKWQERRRGILNFILMHSFYLLGEEWAVREQKWQQGNWPEASSGKEVMEFQACGADIKHQGWTGRRGVKRGRTTQTLPSLCPVSSQSTTRTATKGWQREKRVTIQKGWPHGEKETYHFGRKTLQVVTMMLKLEQCPKALKLHCPARWLLATCAYLNLNQWKCNKIKVQFLSHLSRLHRTCGLWLPFWTVEIHRTFQSP